MANINETARASVFLDGKQANQELKELANRADKLNKELNELKKSNDKSGFDKKNRELKDVKKQMSLLEKKTIDVNAILKKLNSVSLDDLYKAKRKLRREMKGLERDTKEYIEKSKQFKRVSAEIKKVNGAVQKHGAFWARAANNFNKYLGIVSAGVASLAGVVYMFKNMIESNAKLSDSFADVRKTTGLADDEVKALYKDLKKIDTRTGNRDLLNLARIAGKLGVVGKENIRGFVDAANQINVALSEDLGGDPEEAIRQVGKLVDIFKIEDEFGLEQGMLKVGSAINALGASSTANEAYIVEFSKRVAGIAPNANISAANVFGLAATLDQLGQTSEVSSTVFGKLLIAIGKDVPRFAKLAGMSIADFSKLLKDDANEALLTVLDAAKSTEGGVEGMAESLAALGVNGQRSAGVLGVLTKNVDLLREQQKLSNEEFIKGTSLWEEYLIKNTNLAAQIKKLKKEYFNLITLPGVRKFTEDLIKGITNLVAWLKRNTHEIKIFFKAIAIVITSILSYKLAVFALNNVTKIGAFLQKAYSTAVGIATGKIKLATLATKSFNLATKANPLGLILSLLTTAATAFLLFKNKVKDATDKQKEFNAAVQVGIDILKNTQSIENRFKVITKLTKSQLSVLKQSAEEELNILSEKEAKIKETYTSKNNWIIQKIISLRKKLKKTDDETSKMVIQNLIFQNRKLLNETIKKEQGISATELDEQKKRLLNIIKFTQDKIDIINKDNPDPDPYKDEEAFKKELEAEEKFRQQLINASKSLLVQENAAYQERLKKAGLFNKERIDMTKYELEALEVLEKQHIQNIKNINKSILELEDEENYDDESEYLAEKYKKSYDGRLALLTAFHDAGIISTAEYDDKLLALEAQKNAKLKQMENDLAAYKKQVKQQAVDAGIELLNLANQAQYENDMGLLNKQRDSELKSLQTKYDNELITRDQYEVEKDKIDQRMAQEDLKIRQKQARQEKIIAALQVGVSSAQTIFKINAQAAVMAANPLTAPLALLALAQIPWVLGSAAISLGLIAAQPIPQYYKGKYPVTGLDDGKTYNADYAESPGTGLLSTPTILAGELPEIIIDPATTRNLQINYPGVIAAINQARIPQFAGGSLPASSSTKETYFKEKTFTDPAMIAAMNRFSDSVDKIQKEGIQAYTLLNEDYIRNHNKIKNEYDRVRKA